MRIYISNAISVLSNAPQSMTCRQIWDQATLQGLKWPAESDAQQRNTLAALLKREAEQQTSLVRREVLKGRPHYFLGRSTQSLQAEQHREVRQAEEQGMEALLRRIKARITRNDNDAKPQRRKIVTADFVRDANVIALVRLRAKYCCEMPGCGWQGFEMEGGSQFIEVHHLQTLADGGDDTPENAAALCPNCHRELHFGKEREARLKALRAALSDGTGT